MSHSSWKILKKFPSKCGMSLSVCSNLLKWQWNSEFRHYIWSFPAVCGISISSWEIFQYLHERSLLPPCLSAFPNSFNVYFCPDRFAGKVFCPRYGLSLDQLKERLKIFDASLASIEVSNYHYNYFVSPKIIFRIMGKQRIVFINSYSPIHRTIT